jgi:hypothetical protein
MTKAIEIGTKYQDRKGRECEVVDVLKTYNSQGLLLRTRYAVQYEFCGQKITDDDVVAVTIQMRLAEAQPA